MFKKFFLDALMRGDSLALAACQTFYCVSDDSHVPTWECATCGCSDEFDIHQELVCRCDSCMHGCESVASRHARGCKKSRAFYEAGLAFGVVADMLDTLTTWYELEDLIEFFLTIDVPPELKAIHEKGVEELARRISKRQHQLNESSPLFRYISKRLAYSPD